MTRRAKEWRSILEASEFRLRPQETIKGCLEDGAGLSIRVSNQHVSASRELLGTSLSEYYSQLGCVHHVARYHPQACGSGSGLLMSNTITPSSLSACWRAAVRTSCTAVSSRSLDIT